MAPIASDPSDLTSPHEPANPPELPFLPGREAALQEEDAKIEFSKTLRGHYSNGKTGYDRVGALFLTWKDDDMQCKTTEVRAVAYAWNCSSNVIPGRQAQASFCRRLPL